MVAPRWVVLVALAIGAWTGGAGAAERARVGVVALALWSDQGVFRAEATSAAGLLARRFGPARPVVRVNTAKSFAAGPAGTVVALRAASRGLDPARDVLMVVLTSHGSTEGIAEKGGGTEGVLPPAALADLLRHSPVQRKVLIVSACYSGIFTRLASPDLLVITAADATHPSFGCEAGARWTYFGRAFFDQALRASLATRDTLPAVFTKAAALVRAREVAQGFEPSNPQIAGGEAVLPALGTSP